MVTRYRRRDKQMIFARSEMQYLLPDIATVAQHIHRPSMVHEAPRGLAQDRLEEA
jgi:hypothetical protein